jgi:hypothetical protein
MKLTANNITRLILVCTAIIVTNPVQAADSLAVLGAGGLELTRPADIAMESEDLFLSPTQVRVRYVFSNKSDPDITAQVAFPLPEVPSGPGANFDLPDDKNDNFVGFSVVVDGRPITPALEQRAISAPVEFEGQPPVTMKEGIDITDKVLEAGLPINPNLPLWREKVKALPPDVRYRLLQQNILYDDGGTDDYRFGAGWTLRETYHWEQTFPAGKTIAVDHSYKPVLGGSIIYGDGEYFKQYCLDDQTKAGIRQLLKNAQKSSRDAGVPGRELSYFLTTGANWRGPIGDFHLTIDKGNPKAILSLCPIGIEKTGPTTFELRRKNFTPKEDIGLAIFDGP